MTWQRKQRLDALAPQFKLRAEKCAFEEGYYAGFTGANNMACKHDYSFQYNAGYHFGMIDSGRGCPPGGHVWERDTTKADRSFKCRECGKESPI